MGSASRFARKAATVAAGSVLLAGVLAGCGNPTATPASSGSAAALPSNSADRARRETMDQPANEEYTSCNS